ncbi:unnamed protein product [Notodromas monacha]|uniref:OCRE domain-containing protein n=1 Tax=Notodromas monacha TaxID=399045 RepID=A0A7R9BHD8_9CRUS|nr:unnamed protein product [Notodromas monacha]CAG0914695.1 unnamed protein product [Notodromas monacha]
MKSSVSLLICFLHTTFKLVPGVEVEVGQGVRIVLAGVMTTVIRVVIGVNLVTTTMTWKRKKEKFERMLQRRMILKNRMIAKVGVDVRNLPLRVAEVQTEKLKERKKMNDGLQLMEEIKRSGVQPVEVRVLRYRLRNAEQAQGFGVIEFERKEDANAWVENFQVSGLEPYGLEQWSGVLNGSLRYCPAIDDVRTVRPDSFANELELRYTILVRNLEPWTTEDSILRILQTTSSLPIKKISLREAGKSGVVCLIEMYNISDAGELLRALEEREFVTPAGREPVVTYGKPPTSSAAATSNAIDSAQWASKSQTEQPVSFADKSSANSSKVGVPIVQQMPTYDPKNPEQSLRKLAEYSASVYAATPEEWQYYMNYYKDFYAKQAASGSLINSKTQSSAADAAALAVQGAVAKSRDEKANTMGILQAKAILGGKEPLIDIGRIGEKGVQLPPPDTLKYVYDPSSGYYLDPVTHLYYDANTTYYYDAHGSRFLYWDREEQNYLPVNGASDANSGDPKKDKAQAAKKIAKDMEKWAKSMNQKKQSNSSTSVSAVPATTGTPVAGSSGPTSGAADAGFAVLQGKSVAPIRFGRTPLNPTASDFDESNDAESNNDDGDASEFTDWNKLACLLCKRQFPSREVLMKHNSLSALHKENMEKWRMSVAVERKPATEPPRSMYGLHGIKRHR